MMDETEIKCEFPRYENQCYACLSVGRKLYPLGEYTDVFRRITSDIQIYIHLPFGEIKLCWECYAFLRRVRIFEQHVRKANEMLQLGQNYLYGTQSSLATVILNDSHPHTIYVNDLSLNVQSATKICDQSSDDDDDINDTCASDSGKLTVEVECFKMEEDTTKSIDTKSDTTNQTRDNQPLLKNCSVQETKKQKTTKNNSWAKKRALQNKKPKFQIITEYKECYRRVQIDDQVLRSLLKTERDGEYFKAKRFKCRKCVLTFLSQEILEKHNKKFHCKLTKYNCDICTSALSSKRLLQEHVSSHYNKYECTLCDFTCYDKSQTKWHYQKRHRKVFQCVKCELMFGSRWDFFKHYKEWHEKFVCNYCGISFKMRYCIKDHIRKQHSPFECKPCNKRWARYNGLWLHNKTSHGAHNVAYCVECDKQYRDVYRYRWHLANSARHRQHKKHRIPCPGCDKIFSKNIYMKDHYNLVHLKFYKYRCEQCDKNFIRNADLVKHTRRVHEGILPPKNKICYMCGRGFSTNQVLKNHLRTHTGEKPFVCSICNARFAQSTTLATHAKAMHRTKQKQT